MSKIIRKGEGFTTVDNYNLSELSGGSLLEKVNNGSSFKPSFVSKGEANFIAGGFNFDYEGGMSKEEIINRSTKEAEEIVQKANDEAESIRSKARQEGFDEGKNTGFETGKGETIPLIEAFTKLLDELKNIREQFYNGAEEEMINLLSNVAKAVLGEAIKNDPSLVRHAIGKAVGQLQNKEEMTIHLNSEDIAEAEKFRPELAKQVESIDKVIFKGDPNFTRGGCMVETNIGSIDARVETQLESIRESFINAISEKKAEGKLAEASSATMEEKTLADNPAQPEEEETKDDTGDEG